MGFVQSATIVTVSVIFIYLRVANEYNIPIVISSSRSRLFGESAILGAGVTDT